MLVAKEKVFKEQRPYPIIIPNYTNFKERIHQYDKLCYNLRSVNKQNKYVDEWDKKVFIGSIVRGIKRKRKIKHINRPWLAGNT